MSSIEEADEAVAQMFAVDYAKKSEAHKDSVGLSGVVGGVKAGLEGGRKVEEPGGLTGTTENDVSNVHTICGSLIRYIYTFI